MSLLSLLLAFTLSPSIATQVGGEYEALLQVSGGTTISGAGDVDGDGFDDIIIGSPFAAPGGITNSGAVFVYSGSTGQLLHQFDGIYLNGHFGDSVSSAGDVNNDGYSDLIIGASEEGDAYFPMMGSVYVFSGENGVLLYRYSGGQPYGTFGISVSDVGDVNNDNFADFIIGSPYQSPGGTYDEGVATVYSGSTGLAIYSYAGFSVGISGSELGSSVSDAGDVDGDGFSDFIIGAPNEWVPYSGFSEHCGKASIYSGATGGILFSVIGAEPLDRMGSNVSAAGDLDGDGFDDVLLAAIAANPGGISNAGSIFVYSGATHSLLYQFDGSTVNQGLGRFISDSGDVNGDGLGDFLISNPGADPGGLNDAGSVFLYSGPTGTLLHQFDGQAASSSLGAGISAAGDVNDDGLSDIMMRASGNGATYVFGFNPFLVSSSTSISASSGATANLILDFPPAAGLNNYKILISATGIGPSNFGVEIPLTLDSLVIDTFHGSYPVPVHSNMHGVLNANSSASASLTVPAGIPPGLIGRTYFIAAIANQPGQLPEYSSAVVSIEIVL